MKYTYQVIVGLLCLGAVGCVSNKKLIYMQDLTTKEPVSKTGELIPYDIEEYRLQYNDVVDISIKTTSPELNEILNVQDNDVQLRNLNGLNSGDIFFLSGYTIDDKGSIELPLVGEVKLVGLDVDEAKSAIEVKLQKFVNKDNYYVRVRLGGIRYSALGEFNKPGKFTILQNRVTIFEAIANAGDMTTVAKRGEVVILRQYPEGVRTHTVNLLSDKIMESDYFFIRPNDLLYVRPMKVKQIGTGVTLTQTFSVVVSVLTLWLLYLNVVN